jgi:hypothetical protein
MGNLIDGGGIVGYVSLECYDCDGSLRWRDESKNMITTPGDSYYAAMSMALVGTPNTSQPSKVTCMKLGNGTPSTDAKTGAGAGVENYILTSNQAFDSTSPTVAGNVITYITTFGPGVGTDTAISNIAICKTNGNSTSASGDCIARKTLGTARNKQSGDTLIATWTHTFLGA